MTKEQSIDIMKTIQSFIKDNDKQLVTQWNGATLQALIQNKLNTILEADNSTKENKSEKKKE